MGSLEKSQIKIIAIINVINNIKLTEYKSLTYGFDKWIISYNEYPRTVQYADYSRVYVFNVSLDHYVLRNLLMHYNLISEKDLEIESNLSGYLILKYPVSEVPQII
ncbi:hypothetical protein CLV32_0046 [Pedobacter duraquae]|uniref:Uncharacterized protein n=1 Tax=Pedobacter duraquae TaxID=425511 RepID=A0A4R6INR7_9SPHI|nr:hypothetical protein CLV32_0046 [Pedobacter duraquae]